MDINQSKNLFRRALHSIPGGVNSPVRAYKSVGMDPLFIDSAKGSKIFDQDGNEFIDYVGSWGPMILGHGNLLVLNKIEDVIQKGLSFGAPTFSEIALAELIKSAIPSIDLVRMVNSGTEATMSAIRVARGYTKKDKIIKFIGCYHGHADYLLVKAGSGALTLGTPDSPGVPQSFVEHTLLANFNDLDSVGNLLEQNHGDIAAIILEPIAGNMGMILPSTNFLQGLRNLCDQNGIVLIFDEVMTGFRVSFGGAQDLFHIVPDMTCLGKIIGGGLPVGAYGGRQDIMEVVSPSGTVYQAGTLSGNPIAMTAGIATLEELKKPGFYEDFGSKTSWLINELKEVFDHSGHNYRMSSICGMFGFSFINQDIHSYDQAVQCDTEKYAKLFKNMLLNGVYLAPSAFESAFISTAHTDEDLKKTVAAFKISLDLL